MPGVVRIRRACRGMLILTACAAPAAAQPSPPSAPAWSVTTLDQVDLWYHGLAVLGYGVDEPAALYDPGYGRHVRSDKDRLGISPTPLDRAAVGLAGTFAGDPAFEILHFLPLYFASTDWSTMLEGLRTLSDGGSPVRRIAQPHTGVDPRIDRTLGALAASLPRRAQRTALRRFAELLDYEWGIYLRDQRLRSTAMRAAHARALEQRWNTEFAPALRGYLTQIDRERGTIILSPSLGREGRTVERWGDAAASAIVAIAPPRSIAPAATRAAAFDVLRELCFATSRAVIEDPHGQPVDPVAAEQLNRNTAIRCGALVLERYLPQMRAGYEAHVLATQPRESSPDSATGHLAHAFPLPWEVERRLARVIESP